MGDNTGRQDGGVGETILAIDTSGAIASVALLSPELEICESIDSAQSYDESLSPRLQQILKRSPRVPTGIVVCLGPGSFTGLRIGLAWAKGYAHAQAIPLCGVSSLAAVAAVVLAQRSGRVAVIDDARRGELFFGVFERADGDVLRGACPEAIISEQALSERMAQLAVRAGDLYSTGFIAKSCGLSTVVVQDTARGAAALFRGGFNPLKIVTSLADRANLQPEYLRRVEAKTIAERAFAAK